MLDVAFRPGQKSPVINPDLMPTYCHRCDVGRRGSDLVIRVSDLMRN